jgi:hypothetical protein
MMNYLIVILAGCLLSLCYEKNLLLPAFIINCHGIMWQKN